MIEIPAITREGEEFLLTGNDFSEGAVGRVDQVIGQGGGRTRVRMSLLRGEVLYTNSEEDTAMLEVSRNSRNPRRGGSRGIDDPGGSPLPSVDLRPRTGPDSQIVSQDKDPILSALSTSAQESDGKTLTREEHMTSMGIKPTPESGVGGGRRSRVEIPHANNSSSSEANFNVFLKKDMPFKVSPDPLDLDPWGDES